MSDEMEDMRISFDACSNLFYQNEGKKEMGSSWVDYLVASLCILGDWTAAAMSCADAGEVHRLVLLSEIAHESMDDEQEEKACQRGADDNSCGFQSAQLNNAINVHR